VYHATQRYKKKKLTPYQVRENKSCNGFKSSISTLIYESLTHEQSQKKCGIVPFNKAYKVKKDSKGSVTKYLNESKEITFKEERKP